jgi:hypothetical protein
VSDPDDYDTHRIIGLDIGNDSKSDTIEPALSVVHLALDLETEITALEYFDMEDKPKPAGTLVLNTHNGMMFYFNERTNATFKGDVSDLVAALEALADE